LYLALQCLCIDIPRMAQVRAAMLTD
jgi:hypothetical protein